jgi:hypothetical protein
MAGIVAQVGIFRSSRRDGPDDGPGAGVVADNRGLVLARRPQQAEEVAYVVELRVLLGALGRVGATVPTRVRRRGSKAGGGRGSHLVLP